MALLPLILDAFRHQLNKLIEPRQFHAVDFTTSLSTFVLRRNLNFFTEPESLALFRSVPHSRREYFRSSYHGGRVFVPTLALHVYHTDRFESGNYTAKQRHLNHLPVAYHNEPLYYADINSSYPYVMTLDMPCGEMSEEEYPSKLLLDIDYETKYTLYQVTTFIFPRGETPMLPVVALDGTLIYPETWSAQQHSAQTKGK